MAKKSKRSAKKQCSSVSKVKEDLKRPMNPLFVEEVRSNLLSLLQFVQSKLFIEKFVLLQILENIVEYLKEPETQLSISHQIGKYRLVCKFWDKEIIKMIRRKTHIKLYRIVSPYPEGFGWTYVGREKTFEYKVPYQQICSFENIDLDFHSLSNIYKNRDEGLNWFIIMGSQVKSLIYNGLLRSSQPEEFKILERILKEWCPNLERLTFKEVRCFESLVFTSYFTDSSKEIICKNLKELTIKTTWNECFAWPKPDEIPNIIVNPTHLNEFIYNHGLPWKTNEFPDISNGSGAKVFAPKDFDINANLPDFSKLIPKNFFPDYLDGGILGQLMKYTKVKKLRFEGALKPINREHLVAFFHYQQNNWKTSLKCLELDWRYSTDFTKHFVILASVKFPIVTLKLTDRYTGVSGSKTEDMTRFLAYFADTLQHLEFECMEENKPYKLVLPLLPKLKTFVNDKVNVFQCSANNLIKCAPNLEKCHLEVQTRLIDSCRNVNEFFDESYGVSNKQLKDFSWTVGYNVTMSGAQASQLLNWFSNLTRLELTGMKDDNVGMLGFIQRLVNSEVKHFILSWSQRDNSDIVFNSQLIREIGNLESKFSSQCIFFYVFSLLLSLLSMVNKAVVFYLGLISLEMVYQQNDVPFLIKPKAFQNGFTRLQYLKLTNFGVSVHIY